MNQLNKEPRTVYFDCQLLQTSAWYRGMGRYYLSLILAYAAANKNKANIVLIFNKNLPVPEERLARIKTAAKHVYILHVRLPLHFSDTNAKRAQKVLDRLVSKSDTFIQGNIFTFDFYPYFPTQGKRIMVGYDIMPLLFWEQYRSMFRAEGYLVRFKLFKEADKIVTISQTVADSLHNELGIPYTKLLNISGAAISEEVLEITKSEDEPDIQRVEEQLSNKQYLFLNTSDFPNKNNLFAAAVTRIASRVTGKKVYLVLNSVISRANQEKLQLINPDIVFLGRISDDALAYVYQSSIGVIAPSLYEGLGLSILEAAQYNKPLVVSDMPTHREFAGKYAYFFDPYDLHSGARAVMDLYQAIEENRQVSSAELQQLFVWDISAELLERAIVEPQQIESRPSLHVVVPELDSTEVAMRLQSKLSRLVSDYDMFVETQIDYRRNNSFFMPHMANQDLAKSNDNSKSPRYYLLTDAPGLGWCVLRLLQEEYEYSLIMQNDFDESTLTDRLCSYIGSLYSTNLTNSDKRFVQEQVEFKLKNAEHVYMIDPRNADLSFLENKEATVS